jgi:hypothetical protein
MRRLRWTILVALILAGGTACIPRQIKPVAEIDPAPLLRIVNDRQEALKSGITGSLELAIKDGKRRFSGKVYIVAYPGGRFRLEVPGPFGGTHLVMVSDNTKVMAFYPGKNIAFRSTARASNINPHLPFPLPVEPARLPALIMGVLPPDSGISGINAHIMDSGDKQLQTTAADGSLQYTWLFEKGSGDRPWLITIKGEELGVSIYTLPGSDHLPRNFKMTLPDGILKGVWEHVKPFKGDESAFELHIPPSTPITDLEASP